MAWWNSQSVRDHTEVMTAIKKLSDLTTKGFNAMATKEQLDKLRVDVAKLIEAGVDEIKAAVQKAQTESQDPAIDALDTSVNDATATLVDAAAKLRNPPTA